MLVRVFPRSSDAANGIVLNLLQVSFELLGWRSPFPTHRHPLLVGQQPLTKHWQVSELHGIFYLSLGPRSVVK